MVEDSLLVNALSSSHVPMLSKKRSTLKKDTMFSMDLSLLKIIESRMSSIELEKVDKMVVSQLIKILEKLLHDTNNEEDIIDIIDEWEKSLKLKSRKSSFQCNDYIKFVTKELESKLLLYEGNIW